MTLSFAHEAKAQTNVSVDTDIPVFTQLSNVRFEFIQSTQNNFQAFLLDKYTGQVWRYKIGKKEFEELEALIAKLEQEKADIESALCSGSLSVDELTEKSKRLPELNDLIDEKTMRWLELSEIEG